MTLAPWLVFAIGNVSRGDDALGPLLVRELAAGAAAGVECLEEYQLQIEHVTDLHGRRGVVFVDADVACQPPCRLEPVAAARDASFSSHAMSPAALLQAYADFYAEAPPPSWVLRIRGESFGLGEAVSSAACAHLAAAQTALRAFLSENAANLADAGRGAV